MRVNDVALLTGILQPSDNGHSQSFVWEVVNNLREEVFWFQAFELH